MTDIAFPSLELYAEVHARMTYGAPQAGVWGAKTKMHGMNMSVVVQPDGTVVAQSRAQTLDAETNDTTGFLDAVEAQRAAWAQIATDAPITVFGEWAGPRLQKGAAVCLINAPRFFVFAVGLGTMRHPQNPDRILPAWMITDPDAIAALLAPAALDPDAVRVLPWMDRYTLDFGDQAALDAEIERLNRAVDALDTIDPLVAAWFGVKGPGEGYVLTPISTAAGELDGATYGRRAFKAKTERHRVRKQGKPAVAKEAPPDGLDAFVATYVTPARCEQGLQEACGGTHAKAQTGAFVAWMATDVAKESGADVTAMGTTFDVLKPAVLAAARTWFLARCSA